MTSSPIPVIEVASNRHSLGRVFMDATVSYLRWGYGALILSCVAYGYYIAVLWATSSSVRLSASLAAIATAFTLTVAGYLWLRRPAIYRLLSRLSRPTSESPKPHPASRSR
jgi:hypothetical protein